MSTITKFKSDGSVTGVTVCPESMISIQLQEGESYIEGEYPANRFFVDVAGGVAVTKEPPPSEHHIFNYTTKQWEDPRTLADLKGAQWEMIKQARSAAEYAGFTWDGSTFDSDTLSQNRITGAVTLAQLSPNFTIHWTLANNSTRTLSQADMIAVGVALGQHVQAQFTKAQGLRVQIEAATSWEQVAAVMW